MKETQLFLSANEFIKRMGRTICGPHMKGTIVEYV